MAFALAGCLARQRAPASTGTIAFEPIEESPASDAMDDAAAAEKADHEPETATEDLPLPTVVRPPHPLLGVNDDALEAMLLSRPEALGSVSVGFASSGALFGAVPMPTDLRWTVVNPREAWGTAETVDSIARAIEAVNLQFPNTLPIHVGDISAKQGGHLSPHVSHQSGRDVDLGYYYTTPEAWYTTAGAKNLDIARSWALVRAFITETDVEYIFIDRKIQAMLKDYALSIGEPAVWIDSLFEGGATGPSLIRHESGHDTHLHVRFYNPVAQETGRRLYKLLLKHKKVRPPTYFVKHKVKKGDSLISMAKKYQTTTKAIQRANGLKNTRIYAGRTYKIPKQGGIRAPRQSARIPDRRIPPRNPTPAVGTK